MISDSLTAPVPPVRRDRRRGAPRWGWSQTLVMVVAVLGIGTLMYPAAASWLSAWKHDTDVDGYVQAIESLPPATSTELLEAAREYNADLPAGPLRDPYALGEDGQQTAVGAGSDEYFAQLAVPGTTTMARISIPAIGVDLPVYHGTDDATLARGIGHLFGSGLPVGGEGTHAVLTGHSGFVQATMFDDVNKLTEGDEIIITVLGERLYYEVDAITTVLPDDAAALRQVPGEDYLSLVTCTPTGVNTHRLIVRAERIPAPADDASGATVLADDGLAAGFPWWVVALIGVPAVAFLLVKPRRPNRTVAAHRDDADDVELA